MAPNTSDPLDGPSPRPKILWAFEIPHALLLTVMWLTAILVWPTLPDLLVHWTGLAPKIPVHPDGYGGKVHALLMWPIIASALYMSLLVAPKFFDTNLGTVGLALFRFLVTAFLGSFFFAYVLFYEGYRVDLGVCARVVIDRPTQRTTTLVRPRAGKPVDGQGDHV